jgi:hypothetical protein
LSFEFHLDLGAADGLPLCICQWGPAILTSEFFLQIPGGNFSTHNSNGTLPQARKHLGQSGERRIRFEGHEIFLPGDNVTFKCVKFSHIVISIRDILQKYRF